MKKYIVGFIMAGVLSTTSAHAGQSITKDEILKSCGQVFVDEYKDCDEVLNPHGSTSTLKCHEFTYPVDSACTTNSVPYEVLCNGLHYQTCHTCQDGWDIDITIQYETIGMQNIPFPLTFCVKKTNPCTNCTSDTTWSAGGTGYVKKVSRTCTSGSCVVSHTDYQCAAGYYGAATRDSIPTCTRCPTENGVTGTSAQNTTSRDGCCLPLGTTFNNGLGSVRIVGTCCAE